MQNRATFLWTFSRATISFLEIKVPSGASILELWANEGLIGSFFDIFGAAPQISFNHAQYSTCLASNECDMFRPFQVLSYGYSKIGKRS